MKKPTFNDLIQAYGTAVAVSAVANADQSLPDVALSLDALRRALRKAGIPLEQAAPQ